MGLGNEACPAFAAVGDVDREMIPREVKRGGQSGWPSADDSCIVHFQEPVSEFGAATGFDSGDPRNRRKIDRTTTRAVERNSDCQFWNDSNQNWALPRWSIMAGVG